MHKNPSLLEYLEPERNRCQILSEANSMGGKDLYLKGIFIQGDIRNQNQRIYPTREIEKAVAQIAQRINKNGPVPGECQHPEELEINLDRISHLITEMWMEGNDGYGKMKIVPTPLGNLTKILIESGMKLGVSSRGSGNVNDNGIVSDFEIVTVDIVAQPSAPDAYPKALRESLFNMKGGHMIYETARYAHTDKSAEKEILKFADRFIRELKI